MFYIVLIALGTFFSGWAAPAPQTTLSDAGSDKGSSFHLQQKVKSHLELGHQHFSPVHTLTSQRHLPGGLEAEATPLRPPFVRLGAPVARLAVPAAKCYLDHIYPTHHFW